jgi:hypothetical protein
MPRLRRRRAQRVYRDDDPQPRIGAFGIAPSAGDVEVGDGHSLLDHLVGASEERGWHLDPKRLRGPQVDYQRELGRLVEWNLARLRTSENLVNLTGGVAKEFRKVLGKGHEAADFGKLMIRVNRRQSPFVGQLNDEPTVVNIFRFIAYEERIRASLRSGPLKGAAYMRVDLSSSMFA